MRKLLILFFLAGCLHVPLLTRAQGISLEVQDAPLENVFNLVQQQSPYRFVYVSEDLAGSKKVTVSVTNANIETLLEKIFKGQPIGYNLRGQVIMVSKNNRSVSALQPGGIVVTGKVMDEEGKGLPAVTVTIKAHTIATATDDKGNFILKDIDPAAILLVSSVGYESQQVNISGRTHIIIQLKQSINTLDETVIKGFYSTSKRLNTGNVGKVTAVDIEKQPVSNPLQALEGRVAGLYIIQRNGLPGSGFAVTIRGRNSIANGNTPFYIIDGVPFTSTSIASSTTSLTTFGGSPLSSINPGDIESIEILKDADATAIYGSRGANGVILITTKKGKSGKSKLVITMSAGGSKVSHMIKLLETPDYLQMRHEAFTNDGAVPTTSRAPDLLLWDTTRNTDWQKYAYGHTAHTSDLQVSYSGGNTNTQFLVGAFYHKESTVYANDFGDKKTGMHFNLSNSSLNQKLRINFSANYSVENTTLPLADLSRYVLNLPPDAPQVYDSSGKLNWANNFTNPFGYLLDKYKTNTDNLISNAQVSYQLLPGLEFKTSGGYAKLMVNEKGIVPKTSYNPAYNPVSGFTDFASSFIRTWIIEPQLQYRFTTKHSGALSFLTGATFQENLRESITQEANGFSSDALLENMGAGSSIKVINTTYTQYRYNAVFARLNYNFRDKYLVNLTARRDGSSRFGPDKQFSNFGALGVAWVFSKENFIQQHFSFLSFGKLRLSYGISGNDQIADYGYLALWSPTSYSYQGLAGLTPSRLANANFSWERNKKIEIALELGLFNDRVLFNVSYFRNRADNQLVGYPLPQITGQSSIQSNLPAVVQNSGLEMEFNGSLVHKKMFSWEAGINFSVPRNKLVAYPNLSSSNYQNVYVVGKSLFVQNVFHETGVDSKTGIYQFQDVNGDGRGTNYPADLQPLKEITQQYYGGFQNNFQCKNWKLIFLFQFVKQDGINYMNSYFDAPGTFGNRPALVMGRWQKPGDISSIQKFTQNYTPAYDAYSYAASSSDAYISDASYIKLRNISLSYTIPVGLSKKAGLQEASIYLAGQNLFTVTNFKGSDPENQYVATIPTLKTITVGIKLSF